MTSILNYLHLHVYNFITVMYLAYVAGVAVVYRFTPVPWRSLTLAFASYFVYFNFNHRLTILLFAFTSVTYGGALWMQTMRGQRSRQMLLGGLVALLVGILMIFKLPPYWRETLQDAISHRVYLSLALPLGISYYTFKLLSYFIDVYWQKIPPERNFIRFAAYVSFFPQIVAGPIQRYETFAPQIENAPPANFRVSLFGIQRIVLGFFKKFVVADNLGILVRYVDTHLYNHGTPILLGFYAYPLQLYADFSGLVDIAIGSAWLLGVRSPENFNAPFSAPSLTEFWRRWHMTLTCWLTDYVFMPVRMATRELGNFGLVISLFANMILIGLWHGLRRTFLVFGMIHAVYLSVEALTARKRKRYYKQHPRTDRTINWIGPIITFHLVAIALLFFRADRVGDAFFSLGHLLEGVPTVSAEFTAYCHYLGLPMMAGFWAFGIAEFLDYLRRRDEDGEIMFGLPRWARWSVYSCTATSFLVLVVLVYIANRDNSPFLYAVF